MRGDDAHLVRHAKRSSVSAAGCRVSQSELDPMMMPTSGFTAALYIRRWKNLHFDAGKGLAQLAEQLPGSGRRFGRSLLGAGLPGQHTHLLQ